MLRVRSIKSASVQVHVTHQSKCRWIQRSNFVTGLLKQMVTGELCVLQKSKLLQEQLSEDYIVILIAAGCVRRLFLVIAVFCFLLIS